MLVLMFMVNDLMLVLMVLMPMVVLLLMVVKSDKIYGCPFLSAIGARCSTSNTRSHSVPITFNPKENHD